MPLKCANCVSSTHKVKAYCVETNLVLCEKCVGLMSYQGLKGADWTLEKIDEEHEHVQAMTVALVNVSVVFFLLSVLWRSGVGDDYFKGASTCPALGVGRQALARYDANVFYYYKSSLATYCDIEDSFWRLLMDGWVRGVVSGSDSFLLLFSTLPKAYLFKTAVSTFLRPVYAVLYATCGMFLGSVLRNLYDVLIKLRGMLPKGSGQSGTSTWLSWLWKLPSQASEYIFKKKTHFQQAKLVMWALAASVMLRFIAHLAGFYWLAATDHHEVSIWQVAFEPVFFWYLGHLFNKMQTKLDKTIWKKEKPVPTYHLTHWREKPMKDILENFGYAKGRFMRSWNFYKMKAQDIITVLFDDVFNTVIVLRLLMIAFSLAPVARRAAAFVGLEGMMNRQADWFTEATGFFELDSGRYMSDRLAAFGFSEALLVGKFLVSEVKAEVSAEAEFLSFKVIMQFLAWRLVVPLCFYFLERRWVKYLKWQQDDFKNKWNGPSKNWTDGAYADQLNELGTFWNEVSKEAWEAPKLKQAPKPKGSSESLKKKLTKSVSSLGAAALATVMKPHNEPLDEASSPVDATVPPKPGRDPQET